MSVPDTTYHDANTIIYNLPWFKARKYTQTHVLSPSPLVVGTWNFVLGLSLSICTYVLSPIWHISLQWLSYLTPHRASRWWSWEPCVSLGALATSYSWTLPMRELNLRQLTNLDRALDGIANLQEVCILLYHVHCSWWMDGCTNLWLWSKFSIVVYVIFGCWSVLDQLLITYFVLSSVWLQWSIDCDKLMGTHL